MSETTLRWIGLCLSGAFVLFMIVASAAPKLVGARVATEPLEALGFPAGMTLVIGLIELAGTLLYIFPRTSVLGAVLLTGLLGGAMAAQVRVGSPLLSHQLFGLYLGLFMWGGLWLRDPALRAIFPIRS